MHVDESPEKATIVLHDGDAKFTGHFREVLRSEGIRAKQVTPVSPNLNAYVERFIQTIQQECLDHFVVLGERHLQHIVKEFVAHYHEERPHQSLDNLPPCSGPLRDPTSAPDEVVCHERLGGLLQHYTRNAA